MEANEYRKAAPGRKWSPRELWIPGHDMDDESYACQAAAVRRAPVCGNVVERSDRAFGRMSGVVLSSFILTVPTGMFRRKWVQVAVFAAADAVLLCGSPVQAACAGWLLPETEGAVVLPAWGYPLLVLTTLIAVLVALKYRDRTPVPVQGKVQYCGYLLGWSLLAWLTA